MSESIWWREELWWEKGLFQLGGTAISARQLFTLAGVSAVALAASLPANFARVGIAPAWHYVLFGLLGAVGGTVSDEASIFP